MDMGRNFTPVRASASLPFLAPIVHFDKRRLLDGALTDPIPFDRGQRAGYDKFVIVLTRNNGYRKSSTVPAALVKLGTSITRFCSRFWQNARKITINK